MQITVVIIEDEKRSARFLKKQLEERGLICEAILYSVEEALLWLGTHTHPDLIFSDIQLGDGLSFDIYDQVEVKSKIIFTTAFDQYSLRAFKHNSIDYLLKPIRSEDLDFSIDQFKRSFKSFQAQFSSSELGIPKSYKNIFLQKSGSHLKTIKVKDVSYVYSENKMVYFKMHNGQKHASDFTLEYMRSNLNPERFYQINRQMIIHFDSIDDILILGNSRLKLKIQPDFGEEVFVSRDRVKAFKKWLDEYNA